MKRTLFFLLLTLMTITATAQSFRDEISADPTNAGANYKAYPTPDGILTPTPDGYTPYYISHYGRHGSRYLIDPKEYSRPIAVLAHADSLGLLTEDGKYALESARLMAAEARDRWRADKTWGSPASGHST